MNLKKCAIIMLVNCKKHEEELDDSRPMLDALYKEIGARVVLSIDTRNMIQFKDIKNSLVRGGAVVIHRGKDRFMNTGCWAERELKKIARKKNDKA